MSNTPDEETPKQKEQKEAAAADGEKKKQWTLKDWEDGKIPPDEMEKISQQFAESFKFHSDRLKTIMDGIRPPKDLMAKLFGDIKGPSENFKKMMEGITGPHEHLKDIIGKSMERNKTMMEEAMKGFKMETNFVSPLRSAALESLRNTPTSASQNEAKSFYENLKTYIQYAQNNLGEDEELEVVVVLQNGVTFNVAEFGYHNPTLLFIFCFDDNGKEIDILTHPASVQIAACVRKKAPKTKKRKIGFLSDEVPQGETINAVDANP